MSEAQDRNLPASARKKSKAREDGNVPRSRDLAHFAAVGGVAGLLLMGGPAFSHWAQGLLSTGLRFDQRHVMATPAMAERLAELVWQMLTVVIPLGLVMAAAAVLASLWVGGWNFTWKALGMRLDRVNPLDGVKRLFNKQHLLDTGKLCLLALALGAIGALYLKLHWAELTGLLALSLPAALAQAAHLLAGGLLMLVGVLFFAALIDVPLQKWLWADRLKMSHEEVKQEHKEQEGSPEVKAKVRARMREMSRRRMLAAVPQANLVVMNPQHFAVALRYDEARGGAPRVIAKGADLLALRIKDIARASNVPVLRAPPLARALYTHVPLDQEIPAALFAAVAQVLAFVFRLQRDPSAGGTPIVDGMYDLSRSVEVPAELDPKAGTPDLDDAPPAGADA